MKLTMKLLVLFFGVLLLGNVANAASPREQLKQMVEQLQQNPGDDALREKIITQQSAIKATKLLLIRQTNTMNLVIPDLIRNPAETNIGALCAPLDTGFRRYDGDTICWPDQ